MTIFRLFLLVLLLAPVHLNYWPVAIVCYFVACKILDLIYDLNENKL